MLAGLRVTTRSAARTRRSRWRRTRAAGWRSPSSSWPPWRRRSPRPSRCVERRIVLARASPAGVRRRRSRSRRSRVLVATVVRFGGPVEIVERGYDAFDAPPPRLGRSGPRRAALLVLRAATASDLWKSAWRQYEANSGARRRRRELRAALARGPAVRAQGSRRPQPLPRDAGRARATSASRCSLLALGAPLAAAVVARSHPLVPAAFAAYVALPRSTPAIDWDWELPALTVAALICAAAMLAAARRDEPVLRTRLRGPAARPLAGTLAVAADRVRHARRQHRHRRERRGGGRGKLERRPPSEARKAKRWAPWSSEPWQRLGEAHLGQGDFAEAESDFREAIEREPATSSSGSTWRERRTAPSAHVALARARRAQSRSAPRSRSSAPARRRRRWPATRSPTPAR